jgi:hypothetical protein
MTLDRVAVVECLLQRVPGGEALGLLARQPRGAEAVFDGIERDLYIVADGDFQLAVRREELVAWNDALGLETGVDDDGIGRDGDDLPGDDGARL